jgi:transcriptional regulator with XRE-family HTH domain
MAKGRFKSQGLQALHDQFIGDDPERIASFECAIADATIAQSIYDLRTKAGLSQRELAALVGTTASVICRLEDADYEGHSMAMLRRIAAALGQRVEVRFLPVSSPTHRESGGGHRFDEMTAEEKEWLEARRASTAKPGPRFGGSTLTVDEEAALTARRASQERASTLHVDKIG